MSRISVRGFAVASATAVTTVGCVVGIAAGNPAAQNAEASDLEATAGDATLLADIPAGEQAQVQGSTLIQQADAQAIAADTTVKKEAEEAARKQAAKDAVAKKAAAEKKAAEEKAAKEREAAEREAASRSATRDSSSFEVQSSYTIADVKAIADQIVPADQRTCFSNIVERESTWNYTADNPTSEAYGLVQANPGYKMASVGDDWRTNPATQIQWGLNYMNARYGSPCEAWDFWLLNHSY